MIRTQLYLPEDLYLEAKALAKTKNTSISKLMRSALKLVLASKKTTKSGDIVLANLVGIGSRKTGVDAAINHNEIYLK